MQIEDATMFLRHQLMNKIALTITACLIALSASACAVEVPMSAFRLTPPDATQKAGHKAGAKQLPPQDAQRQDMRSLSIR